ncbi:DUF1542 domain-containing protein [Corynebacterium amycolatum]|uniref:DUF1542 domain-containing protein n=1 Tax=Corynebacterium amycolatum TaxID=43765 RepID=UPI0012446508|nr:DUF1542 domain-containing protein [Corynebacterium amycolatum]KAA9244993.1 DUF1542 domain-containing protein [Corynebacterium amycolatum]
MGALILIAITVGGAIIIASMAQNRSNRAFDARQNNQLEDAVADARRWIERLGSQVLNLAGTDSASTQALADASERYNAASSQISTARTPAQARMARESALEGLHYINAAREIMGLPAGPTLPPLEGQKAAGSVTETRTIEHEGHSGTASPYATPETPNYYPGGRVAGRPVPAGWYSEPWWKSALRTGVWTAGSMLLFSTLFHGMAGVAYGADEFASGMGTGADDFGGTEDFGAEDFGGDDFGGDDLGGDFGGGGADAGDAGDGGGFFDGLFGGGDGGGDGGGFFDGGFDGFDI